MRTADAKQIIRIDPTVEINCNNGTVLIADVPEEEIRQIVDELSGKYEVADYAKQEGNEIHLKYLEHRQPRFSQPSFAEDKEYYIIYFFESQHPLAWSLDLAGH